MRWTIGVDLGGTNLRAAQVDPSGRLGRTRQAAVDHTAGADGTVQQPFGQLIEMVTDLIAEIGEQQQPDALGLAVTGPIDPVTGWVDNPNTLPAAMQGDLTGAVSARVGAPIVVDNDANAAAIGEARFGAGRDGDVVVCVTVGTGIGVGIVTHGTLYEGAARAHPEPGHLVVDPGGPSCYCGAAGCAESLASATALVRSAVAEGVVAPGATARDVHERAARGDQAAERLVENARLALAAFVRTLLAVYAPDIVVLAGNALGDRDRLVGAVTRSVDTFPFGARAVAIRPAELGNWAGCIGIAALAVDRVRR